MKAIFALPLFAVSMMAQATCWDEAARYFDLDPRLLTAIAQVESGMDPEAINVNTNGSYDVGLMQINSTHLARLRKLGVDEIVLMRDPCVSVLVGASILSEMVKLYGYNWEAIGAYNAGTRASRHDLRMRYAKKVWQRYQQLRGF
ncbi:type III secretion system invasion protein IagB [Atlantibacter sp.]|uniref:type III secretion system invasion protein IagB n=1 Tax=Atlantibacter sp. TaxID=1903473 RepID=UPI0028AC16BC|nr:type III secretion system invasion protein IagB [Atlantibacter sp.]